MRCVFILLLLCGVAQAEDEETLLTPDYSDDKPKPPKKPQKPEKPPETDEQRLDRLRRNPKAMAAVMGAELCMADAERRDALTEIAKEKKYSKLGGVENRVVLYALQRRVRRADEFLANLRAGYRKAPNLRSVKPYACKHDAVQILILCKGDDPPEDCTKSPLNDLVGMVETISGASEDDE